MRPFPAVVLALVLASLAARAEGVRRFKTVQRWQLDYTITFEKDVADERALGGDGKAVRRGRVSQKATGSCVLERRAEESAANTWDWECQARASGQHTATGTVEMTGPNGSTHVEETTSASGANQAEFKDVSLSINHEDGSYSLDLPHLELRSRRLGKARFGELTQEWDEHEELTLEAAPGGGPLPRSGLDLGGKTTAFRDVSLVDGMLSAHGDAHVEWRLRPAGPPRQKLEAKVVARPVERGARLTLDASSSTPAADIRGYQWTLTGDCGAHGTTKAVTREGPKVTLTALCPVDVVLRVVTDDNEASASTRVVVTPRPWKLAVKHDAGPAYFPDVEAYRPLVRLDSASGRREPVFAGGQVVCGVGGEPDPGTHIIHPKVLRERSLLDLGFWLKQVSDEGGPFHGWWYVDRHALQIRRKTLLNRWLLPGAGPVGKARRGFYAENRARGHDVDGFLAALRAHEGVRHSSGSLGHVGLAQQYMDSFDPARHIEDEVAPDRELVVKLADAELVGAERALCLKTGDPLAVMWSGQLAFPDEHTGAYADFQVTLGGPNYGQTGDCEPTELR